MSQPGSRVLRLFVPPELATAERSEQARLLHVVTLITLGLVVLLLPLVGMVQPEVLPRALASMSVLTPICLAVLLLNRSGRTRAGSWFYIIAIITIITLSSIGAGGIRSPGVQAYFIFVMLAGLLLGYGTGIFVGIGCALLGLALVLLEEAGILSGEALYSAPALWLLQCMYIGIALLTMRTATRMVRAALSRAEAELEARRQAQERLSFVLDAGAIGVFELDLPTRRLYPDARARTLLQLPATADGSHARAEWMARIRREDLAQLETQMLAFTAGQRHASIACRLVATEGESREFEAWTFLKQAPDGSSDRIVGLLIDVTARRVSERERERLLRDLGERVKELRLLHDVATLLREQRDFDASVLNQLVARMPAAWLYPEDCRVRIVYADMEIAAPDWEQTPWSQEARFTTSAGEGCITVSYLHEHPDVGDGPFLAEERELLESIAQLLRSHIEETVSELQRRELEAQLRHAQKLDALGTLAGGIAHDFNNILTAIGGHAELALEQTAADQPVHGSLLEILRAQSRARDIVKRILLFSRRQEAEKNLMGLGPLVGETMSLIRTCLPAGVVLRTETEIGLPSVLADASQLHQVLMNLVTNAGYAMRESGGELLVRCYPVTINAAEQAPAHELRPGLHACIEVRDQGTGMSPEVQRKLFEPFFTTKGKSGTGLGLSVVHGIVRDHGGAITVESQPGQGTVFRVYLPAATGVPAPEAAKAVIGKTAGQHILLVDDDKTLACLTSRLLEHLGYRCTAFTDVHAALQEFRTAPSAFDCVLSDLQMPNMNGIEFAKAIRAIREDIPVGITTGFIRDEEQQQTRSHVSAWIPKPATLQELDAALGGMFKQLQ